MAKNYITVIENNTIKYYTKALKACFITTRKRRTGSILWSRDIHRCMHDSLWTKY